MEKQKQDKRGIITFAKQLVDEEITTRARRKELE